MTDFVSLACIFGLTSKRFNSRTFRVCAKFWKISHVIKLYVYKGRISLFDFQKNSLVIMNFTKKKKKKTNTHLLLS